MGGGWIQTRKETDLTYEKAPQSWGFTTILYKQGGDPPPLSS